MSLMSYPAPRVGFRRSTFWDINQWPHLASLYASTHNLDEEGKYPDPIMGQDNIFDPSEPYGAYRYYIQPTARSEFSLEEPTYVNRPVYKDEESRSSDYTSGASLKRGSTCRVLLCVFLVLSFIGVVVAAITLAVLLSKTPRSSKVTKAPIEEYESMASLLGRNFNESLLDKNSDDFKQLEKELCIALEQIFKEQDSPVIHEFAGCEVIEFAEGSVLARFRIKLQPKLPDGFKQGLRIRQKIEEHFSRKIKEHGPWQSVKFNPNFIRRFVKIEPPKVETSPPTTASTEKVTKSMRTIMPRLINDTTKVTISKDMTTVVESTTISSANETSSIDATTMQIFNLTDSKTEQDFTTTSSKLTTITSVHVQTTDDVSNITESSVTAPVAITTVSQVPPVLNVTEPTIVNVTESETVTSVTKESKIATTFDSVMNATTTTIDPFLYLENMTFTFNDSSSTEVLFETSDNVTKVGEITAATVDSGTITTTVKAETGSTPSQTDIPSTDVVITTMNVTYMTQPADTTEGQMLTTIAPVENATSVSSVDVTQTAITTGSLGTPNQTDGQVTPTSDTESTPIMATSISVSNETTAVLSDSTQVPEMTTSVITMPDQATSIVTSTSVVSKDQTTEDISTIAPVDATTDMSGITLATTDSITTVQDTVTTSETTVAGVSETTVKPILTSSVQDKITTDSPATTDSVSTSQPVTEISTIVEAANMTNVTDPMIDFFETSTVENTTGTDMVFITETTTTNETVSTVTQSITSTTGIPQTTTDSASMTTVPQQAMNETTATQDMSTVESAVPTTKGADTLTFESLTTVQTHNLTTDIQVLTNANVTDEFLQTTQLKNETIQKQTIAAIDSAPQTFVMPDATQGTTSSTKGPTTAAQMTTMAEQTTVADSNQTATVVDFTTADGTISHMNFTQVTSATEDTLIPETTSKDMLTPQDTTTGVTTSTEISRTTVPTDVTQSVTSSDLVTGMTTITPGQTSETVVATSGQQTTEKSIKSTSALELTGSQATSTSQAEMQNLTTPEMYNNTTAPEMTTVGDMLNDTFPIETYMDNMTTTEAFVTESTSVPNLTTPDPASATELTTSAKIVTSTDQPTITSTEMLMKQDNVTETVSETTSTEAAQISTGQSTTKTLQTTESPQTTTEILSTTKDSVTTQQTLNETQTTSKTPRQTTFVDTVTSINISPDFTTEEILLDNVTSTEMVDLANLTTTQEQTTSLQIESSKPGANETLTLTTSPSETTVVLDTTTVPEPASPTTLQADRPSSSPSAPVTTNTFINDTIVNVTDATSTDSITTADTNSESPITTQTLILVNQTETEMTTLTDSKQTTVNESLTQETNPTTSKTDQATTTLIVGTTGSVTNDTTQTAQHSVITTTLVYTMVKKANESVNSTIIPDVEMPTTDTLLNFTDMFYNFTDVYENVTDGVVTDVTTAPLTSVDSTIATVSSVRTQTDMTESSFIANITGNVTESHADNATIITDKPSIQDTLSQTTMSGSNATSDYFTTTQIINTTDAALIDGNTTIVTESLAQSTVQPNITESITTEQTSNITASFTEGTNTTIIAELTTEGTVVSNITTSSSDNITTEIFTSQEPSNFTSAPSIASNVSDTLNTTELPPFDNSTIIYDMTYNTTDFYYLNETITSDNSNETVLNYTTVLTPETTASNVTEGQVSSNNGATSSSDALADALTMSNESILPVS